MFTRITRKRLFVIREENLFQISLNRMWNYKEDPRSAELQDIHQVSPSSAFLSDNGRPNRTFDLNYIHPLSTP